MTKSKTNKIIALRDHWTPYHEWVEGRNGEWCYHCLASAPTDEQCDRCRDYHTDYDALMSVERQVYGDGQYQINMTVRRNGKYDVASYCGDNNWIWSVGSDELMARAQCLARTIERLS